MGVRRQQGEGSIYQRSNDGRWVGVVDLGWVGGKRVRKSVTAATLRELRPKLARLKASIESGVVPDDATVDQWMRYWLDEIAPERIRPKTLDVYEGYHRRYISPAVGKVRLDSLKPEHVRALMRDMESKGLAPATRRQSVSILQRALKVALREGRVLRNAAELVDKPTVTRNPHGSLTRSETHAMLDLLNAYGDDGRWDLTSRYAVALLGGLRQSEALGLRWEDVDLGEEPRMQIRRSVQRVTGKGLIVQWVKSKSSERTVPLMEPVRFALARHRESAPDGYVWGGAKPTDPRRDYGTWKGLLWSAGCDHHPLHAARATTANVLHEARVPDRVIAAILGHADFEVTWTHYLSAEERQLSEAIREAWRLLERT